MSLLVLGTVAFDSIETPFDKIDRIIGGAATYICYSASFFETNINLVSIIGNDFPNSVIEDLRSRGVNTDGLQIKENEKSFFWAGKYHLNMNSRDTLQTELNVLADFDPKLPDNYKDSEYVMLGNLDPNVQKKVLNQMNKRPKLVVMDTMNFWMDIALDALNETIGLVDILVINDEEARQLTNEFSLVKAANKIQEMGPSYVVIKKGEHGALLFHENNVFFSPALPLEAVFDPTGAGDTFAGGFIGYLSQTDDISFQNMKRAVIYGSAMASFCCEKFGPTKLQEINNSEMNHRVQRFVDLIQFDIELQ